MIIGIAVLSILLFIASVALFVQRRGLVILEEKYWDENRLHLDTKVRLESKYHGALDEISELEAKRFEQWERAEVLEQKNIELKQELSERPLPVQDADESTERGNFVRMRQVRPATAETYRNVFDLTVDGQRILEDLTSQFCKPSYVRGGADAERESCYRAGQGSVVNRILAKINTANDPNHKEEQDND